MTQKRPMGALEEAVMEYLWSAGEPSSPREVHMAVAPDLAYTTVTTILTRLWEKKRLTRERSGRAYLYDPVSSEAEHVAGNMQSSLIDALDRSAVLSQFVDSLSADDAEVLRRLLRRKAT